MSGDLLGRAAPVLAFLAAASVLAGLVGAAGVFDVAAVRAGRLARGRPRALLALLCLLATATTVLLGLDTTAVLVTPVAVALARRLALPVRPYALATVWLAGTASLLLPVSNLTNLLAQGRLHEPTTAFAARTAPAWAACVAVTLLVLAVTSRGELPARCAVPAPPVVADRPAFAAALVALAAFVGLLVLGAAPWVAAAATALPLAALALARGAGSPLALVPWRLVVGVAALFAAVSALGPHGLDGALARLLDGGDDLRLSVTAAALGNVADNLPAYVALERVTVPTDAVPLLVGVDAGTLLTPWGSLATLLWAASLRAAGVAVPWRSFLLRGLLLVPAVLLAAAAVGWLGSRG